MNGIHIKDIDITGGFWKYRQELNRSVTVWAVYDRFKETGRFDALKCAWKEGMPNKPHIFWDSDVAKWIEGASYLLMKEKDERLEAIIDEAVSDIEKNMDEYGYFNSYYLTVPGAKRWSDRTCHELYCAGHLIEAAVAYYEATGKDKFLNLMCRYADYIYDVFVTEKSAAFKTPGHEEIELALIKLYKTVNNKKYLTLSKYFVDERGQEIESAEYLGDEQDKKHKSIEDVMRILKSTQSHLPVREQKTAEGHSVRAVYLYSAMADLAKIFDDAELADSCRSIFDDIINHKMYVTGGIGSTSIYEGFTLNYDLPSAGAYAESCAAIGMCMFAKRMLESEADSRYADICEIEFYNGFLSSTSLSGEKFFYENPLEIQPKLKDRTVAAERSRGEHFAITERVKVFDCSCCPPNIVRFVPSFGEYMYTYDDNTVYVHHYAESTANVGGAKITQVTDYPNSGNIKINTENVNTLALRIPFWCKKYEIKLNGAAVSADIKKGYAYINVNGSAEIEIDFEIKAQIIEANPNVTACAGKVSVRKGVFVYCLEAKDNGENLNCLKIPLTAEFTSEYSDEFKTDVLKTTAYKSSYNADSLYAPAYPDEKTEITLIPYYAFANRGESVMIVWINKANI